MQRMVIDGRYASQCHHRPPHTRLGTPASVASLDFSDAAFAAAGLPDDPPLHIASLDLVDCFYQYT
eukprot:10646119-Heterocapsa_arctica.AAC.1